VARIRSIKPDFFTSEVIASLPLSARLTFIGLWTYVDDNGVGLDNERLIVAAIWPLEADLAEAASRTREDLARLSGAALVTRYRDASRRYLHIRSWEEHQRVSHPGKPRFPVPGSPGLTCENDDPPEDLPRPSGDLHETLRPEQGAGSREQGAGMTVAGVLNGSLEGVIHRPQIQLPTGPWLSGGLPPAPEPPASPRGRAETDAERRRQAAALAEWEKDHPQEAPNAAPA
jgi:hypothetical protein